MWCEGVDAMELSIGQNKLFRKITEKFGLRLIIVFGSSVNGPLHAHSDVDVAVSTEAGTGLSTDLYCDLLENMRQVFPERRIDLACIDHADPLFLKKILEHGELVAGRISDFQRLKIFAFKRYQEYKPYLELERKFAEQYISARAADR